ncbi:phosphopantothenate--cysteine ligase-like [Anneissia japonica]|uniref:phosphopantothenate--cysteine ligase-like n=1 Tax=Anneissia japonica TaxID=1529436 RepID=UPI0014254FA1|nr:phosphopantothenate--cysteine ligase-like [Anneissia japonica]
MEADDIDLDVVDLFFDDNDYNPKKYQDDISKIQTFVAGHHARMNKVVLVTSGGTAIPLENQAVRFIENFSGGKRGAASAEYFLSEGYGVIFLYRQGSLRPYSRHFAGGNILDVLEIREDCKDGTCSQLQVDTTKMPSLMAIVEAYQTAKNSGRLLEVSYHSLVDYIALLKASSEALHLLGSLAVFYLAAAVSDFYIPPSDMPKHKIQSTSGPLQLALHQVPKFLRALVSKWSPKAFVATFKLETDEAILIDKALGALSKYGHQVVIANILHERRYRVIIVTKEEQKELLLSRASQDQEHDIERVIVRDICIRHDQFHKGTEV